MRELTVVEVRLDDDEGSPVLIMKEVEGDRQLAIWMSAASANAILGALQDADPHPLPRARVDAGAGHQHGR